MVGIVREVLCKPIMEILHVASEMAPLAKAGGLGDVLLGLGHQLLRAGTSLTLFLPKYRAFDALPSLSLVTDTLPSLFRGAWHRNRLWRAEVSGIPVLLLDPPFDFFRRDAIYGYPDDIERFTYFSRALFDALPKLPFRPELIHLHDWQSALLAPLLHQTPIPSLLTIHNLEYQGRCALRNLQEIGLDPALAATLQDERYPEPHNLLKGGILYAKGIITVSPTYAQEMMTPEGGHGLDKILLAQRAKCSGILNGIDFEYWNPEGDPLLSYPYSQETVIAQKRKNKEALYASFGRPQADRPLVSVISRLASQKGPELMEVAAETTVQEGGFFALVGSLSDPHYEGLFERIKERYPEDVHIELSYDEGLAHRLFAASDLLVIPSRFEPCGLTQLIAMRYGTLSLARRTGGLADTIVPGENGFLFDAFDAGALKQSLREALTLYRSHPQEWQRQMRNGMQRDSSWRQPAQEYLKLYQRLASCASKTL